MSRLVPLITILMLSVFPVAMAMDESTESARAIFAVY